jgi:branched-subunit amino acid transport protein
MSTWESVIAIVGLAAITLLTRGSFILPARDFPLPEWLRQGLRYAPLAAMAAVVAPEILMTNGQLIGTWKDARIFAAAAGAAWYFWRHSILGTIIAGTATMLTLRVGFGW